MLNKIVYISTLAAFFISSITGPICQASADTSTAFVAEEFRLPAPGVMVRLSPPLEPPILKGIKVYPVNPFRFDFILDKGDGPKGSNGDAITNAQQDQLKQEAAKLIRYFLASLTIPEKDLWVNLSPYEKDRIIPQSFGLTEMGRDLLAEDYMLKQITASLIYPEDETGKKFWKRIYEEAARKYGTTNIPVDTFNKVWIVPEKAVVYENAKAGTAYVVEAKLKVMLEQDYLALSHSVIPVKTKIQNQSDINALGSQIVREIVIPELTKEVNEDKNFAQLRQVYNSLILATWYKKKIKDSVLEQVYADKNKIAGVGYKNSPPKAIYQRYLQAFKKGVYNYIKEEQDPVTQKSIPRKYFSGGFNASQLWDFAMRATSDSAMLPQTDPGQDIIVQMRLNDMINPAMTAHTSVISVPFSEVLGHLSQYFEEHEFRVLKIAPDANGPQFSAQRVRIEGSDILVGNEVAAVLDGRQARVELQSAGNLFDLREMEHVLKETLPLWGWSIGKTDSREYRDFSENKSSALAGVLGENPRSQDSLDWIFRIQDEDFLEPGELLMNLSKYKLGNRNTVAYFTKLLAEEIEHFYGPQLSQAPENWVIVTSSVYKKYNSAIYDLAESLSKTLKISHRTFRSRTGMKDRVNWSGTYSLINTVKGREQRIMEENSDLELEGDQEYLKGKQIIYLDDIFNTGIIIKHGWKMLTSKYHAGPVHIFTLVRLLASNPSLESEITYGLFKNKSWNALVSIIGDSLEEKNEFKQIRFVRNLFKEPTMPDFKSFIAFLSHDQLWRIYDLARSHPLEIPVEHERMEYLKEIIKEMEVRMLELHKSRGSLFEIDKDGFLIGRAYSLAFIKREREIASQQKTIVFDRDNTLGYYDKVTDKFILREGIIEQLHKLKQMGYRLVLWTRSTRPFINKDPQELKDCFDLKITMENYSSASEEELRQAYDFIGVSFTPILKIYQEFKDAFKDITLFKYALIVDDKTFEQSMAGLETSGQYRYFKIPKFSRDSPKTENVDQWAERINMMASQNAAMTGKKKIEQEIRQRYQELSLYLYNRIMQPNFNIVKVLNSIPEIKNYFEAGFPDFTTMTKIRSESQGEVFKKNASDLVAYKRVSFSAFNIRIRLYILEIWWLATLARIAPSLRVPKLYKVFAKQAGGQFSLAFEMSSLPNSGDLSSGIWNEFKLIDKLDILISIAQEMQIIHRFGIVHKDIKPPNILVNTNKDFMWIDFNISEPNGFVSSEGSDGFRAPEKTATIEYDMFSFGKTLLKLRESSTDAVSWDDFAKSGLKSLVDSLLNEDPTKRPDSMDKVVGRLIEVKDYFISKETGDKAMKGGIDLTPAKMNLQTRVNDGEIRFHLDPAMLQQLKNTPGFVPVIIDMQPLRNLRQFLGAFTGA